MCCRGGAGAFTPEGSKCKGRGVGIWCTEPQQCSDMGEAWQLVWAGACLRKTRAVKGGRGRLGAWRSLPRTGENTGNRSKVDPCCVVTAGSPVAHRVVENTDLWPGWAGRVSRQTLGAASDFPRLIPRGENTEGRAV